MRKRFVAAVCGIAMLSAGACREATVPTPPIAQPCSDCTPWAPLDTSATATDSAAGMP